MENEVEIHLVIDSQPKLETCFSFTIDHFTKVYSIKGVDLKISLRFDQ